MSRRVNTCVQRAFGALIGTALLSLMPAAAAAQTRVVIDDPRREVFDTRIQGGALAHRVFHNERLATKVHPSRQTFMRRSLLKFDTHNTVPAGSTVQSATLTLTISKADRESRTVGVYRLSQTFDENYATWYSRKPGLTWTSAGADVAERWAQASVGSRAGSKVTFDVTALVQRVVSGGYGSVRFTRIALVDAGRGSNTSYKEFYSSEARDPAVRPMLTVVYGKKSTATPAPTRPAPNAPQPSKPESPKAPSKPEPPKPAPTVPEVPEPDNSGSGSGSGSRLRLLNWNTHYGVGTDGKYNIDRIATFIAKFNPDVVSLNEVTRYAYYNGSEDQASRYAALLKAKTGRTWYYHYKTDNGAARGVGNMVLSRFPIASTSSCQLSGRRVAVHAAIYVNGRLLNVWSTHLDSGLGDSSNRVREVRALIACTSAFAQQRIIAGDFNGRDHTSEIGLMESVHYDGWAEAARDRAAVDYPGNTAFGATRNRRIDYIFYSKGAASLEVRGAQVFDTRDARGHRPSDHKPLLVTFKVN